ncbi:MAG: hypothetical protein FWE14_11185 [Lachnospiraceae bacterium]|nr:hypothetical protein [Lachnospiraceae bacterium]
MSENVNEKPENQDAAPENTMPEVPQDNEKTVDDKSQLTVGGFIFASQEDAEFAKEELKKIEYLEKKMNYHLPENILSVYNKVMESKMLKTPLGIAYLNRMQSHMRQVGIEEGRINPIPVYTSFTKGASGEITEGIARQRIERQLKKEKSEADKFKGRYKGAILVCLLLCGLICAMFYITIKSDNPNILNYEKNLLDRYASWEQDLKERENFIREKERELYGED